MKSIARLLILLTFFVLAASCERSTPTSSKVTISMGGSLASNLGGAAVIAIAPPEESPPASDPTNGTVPVVTGCTLCIRAIVINVDGGDFSTIAYSDRLVGAATAGEELVVNADLLIPTGSNRLFQVLALVYDATADKLKMQYGYSTQNLANIQENVPITMSWITGSDGDNEIKPSSIVGRYLTGLESGPTGAVKINYKYQGRTNMKIQMGTAEINNGWFTFGASENFPLTYEIVETNETVFSDVTSTSLNPSVPVNYISYIKRPRSYFILEGNNWVDTKSYGNILYGYFKSASADVGVLYGKYVKQEAGSHTLANLKGSTGESVTYAPTLAFNPAADIYSEGLGLATSQLVGPVFGESLIRISAEQFNGHGNDIARATEGAFTFSATVTGVSRFSALTQLGKLQVTLAPLPGLFGPNNRYGGVKVYTKSSPDYHRQNFNCDAAWLISRGFVGVNLLGTTSIDPNVVFTINPPAQIDTVIVCPTLNSTGGTETIGGIYLTDVVAPPPPVM